MKIKLIYKKIIFPEIFAYKCVDDDGRILIPPAGWWDSSSGNYMTEIGFDETGNQVYPKYFYGHWSGTNWINGKIDCEQQCNGEAVLDECGLCGGDCIKWGPIVDGVQIWICGDAIPENNGVWCNCEEGVGPFIPLEEECGECGGTGPDEFGCCSGDDQDPYHQVADCHGNCYDYYGDQYPNPVIPPNDYDDCGVCLPPEGAEGYDSNVWGESCEFYFSIEET